MNPVYSAGVLISAAFLGDNVNYWVGRLIGKELAGRFPRLVRPQHLERTHQFFEKYGRKTIIFARFVPIIRTFTPFVAGMGAMPFGRFIISSGIATLLWVGLILPAGWFFGNLGPVKRHFELVVVGIIFISALPMLVELVLARRNSDSSD
jgi:membrane-associated protein